MAKDGKEEKKDKKKATLNIVRKMIEKKVGDKAKGLNFDFPLTLLKITLDKDCNLNVQVPFECLEVIFSD